MDNKQARKTGRTVMVCGFILIALTEVKIGGIMVALGALFSLFLGRCPHCGKFLIGLSPSALNCPRCKRRL